MKDYLPDDVIADLSDQADELGYLNLICKEETYLKTGQIIWSFKSH